VRIGFYHVATRSEASELGYLCARKMVKSARKHMQAVEIVHFTDLTSPTVKGVTATRRKPSEPMALLRMRHHASVEGDWLFVDTDVLFQAPVTSTFKDAEWDIGVTTRNWPHLKAAEGFSDRMPYNMGVVFSRNHRFWMDCYTRLRDMDHSRQKWMGDQEAFCEAIASDRYAIKRFSGVRFNYPPVVPDKAKTADQLEEEASILHYKGPERKDMMLHRQEPRRCA